jgi:hypothetical protein
LALLKKFPGMTMPDLQTVRHQIEVIEHDLAVLRALEEILKVEVQA